MSIPIRLRVIEVEGDAGELLPIIKRLLDVDGRLQELPPAPAPAGEDAHVHHWRIESPNGPTSIARCDCGADKAVGNSEEAAAELSGQDPGDQPISAFPKGRRGVCRRCGHGSASRAHREACKAQS